MIEVNDLKKSFGEKVAIDIAHYHVDRGEIIGLVGNNGAGKTTFFRLLLDLLQWDEGNITINGIEVSSSEDWKLMTGAFLDESFLIDFLTPEEFFYFIGRMYKLPKAEVDERLKFFEPFMNNEVLGQHKYIRNFSAGNKQKIGIIAAMLHRPDLLVLDEPFNFLDPSSQAIMKQMILQYQKEFGATILISSHNLTHTIDISTRIALLENGCIIRDISTSNGSAEADLSSYFQIKANAF